MRYDNAMKTKPTSDEYRAFENILAATLTVSKAELDRRLKAEKEAKHPKSASPASASLSKPS